MKLCGFRVILDIKIIEIKNLRQKHQKHLIFQAFLWIFSQLFDIIYLMKKLPKEVKKSMNNISQISIFDYSEIENLGDLERLKLFFENVNDEKLCKSLEQERKKRKE